MTLFAANGTLTAGTATNRWDESVTLSLGGLRTRGNKVGLLLNSGDNLLAGDATSEAIIYDLILNGAPSSVSHTTQRFVNTFTTFNLGAGNDLLDLTVNPTRQVTYGIANYTQAVTAIGGSGHDTMWTGYGGDTVYGDGVDASLIHLDISLGLYAGFSDNIDGGDGADTIYGDFGNLAFLSVSVGTMNLGHDTLRGGNGVDTIYGDAGGFGTISVTVGLLRAGDDTIYGGAGADILVGDFGAGGLVNANISAFNFGSDTIYGGADGDTIVGDSTGNLTNLAVGAVGDDFLYGEAGNDTITGDFTGALNALLGGTLNFGDDTIEGGDGDDNLVGDYRGALSITNLSFGQDVIRGGAGNDTIYGDTNSTALLNIVGSADFIDGGAGNDQLYGDGPAVLGLGGGADTFYFAAGSGQDRIHDFNRGLDTILIDIPGIDAYSDLTFTTPFLANYTIVNLGNGNNITVDGGAIAGVRVLNASDFDFI